MAPLPLLSIDDVGAHNKPDDLWLVVDNVVYDLTAFAQHHPGGEQVLLRFAGRDATRVYSSVHGPSLIAHELDASKHKGRLDVSTITPQWAATALASDADADGGDAQKQKERTPLDEIVNLADFAAAAEPVLPLQAWSYVSTGTEDNITRDANNALLRRIWLRPAVLRDVSLARMDLRTTLFGTVPLAMPVYVAPTGATRTGGRDGELAIARGASAAGIVQVISTVASYPYNEILAEMPRAEDGGQAMFQLYVDRDHRRSEALLTKLLAGPHGRKIKAVLVTVDLPVSSKREADERARARVAKERDAAMGIVSDGTKKEAGIARQNGSFVDSAFCWEDLAWLRATVDAAVAQHPQGPLPAPLPILAKGIQRAEDARLALQHGCQGIVISNHGGRAADTASPAILTLLEMQRCCPEVFGRMEILIDGGFRRGSDVLKAICLGASAVGIGRPFVYAVGYGQAGVEQAASILYDEILTTMQLCGLTHLMRDASPDYVNTGDIDHMVMSSLHHPYAKKPVWPAKL